MFCSQCGKKVMENMLFCPFCGSPIVIPDQDEIEFVVPQKPANAENVSVPAPVAERSAETVVRSEDSEDIFSVEAAPETVSAPEKIRDERQEPQENIRTETIIIRQADPSEFKPLDLEAIAGSEPIEEQPVPEESGKEVETEISELLSEQLKQEPVKLEGHVPDLTNVKKPKTAQKKRRSTYAPVREFNPNDIFLDGGDKDYDDYDDEDDAYEYEDREEGGFFVRHIRGLVALGMMVIMLAVLGGWAISEQGQLALAKSNLAWRPTAYQKLGYQAYQNGNYLLAGQYYSQALARDEDEYAYATSACVSYFTGNNMEKAVEMARRAIEIDPSEKEAYSILLRIYPNQATRPWEITSLIQQGFRITGDTSFNIE